MRDWLLSALKHYRAFDERETAMVYRLIDFLEAAPHPFDRATPEGHVTASAWVTDASCTHALLTHHRRLERWLQLGGHVESDATLLDSALREVHEESGLTRVRALYESVWDVDIHKIPKPDHLHYDIRFLMVADRSEPLTVSSESKELAWFPIDGIAALSPEPSIARLVLKHRRDLLR